MQNWEIEECAKKIASLLAESKANVSELAFIWSVTQSYLTVCEQS